MEISLKGVVVSKYGSVSKLAREISWSERKARDIINGRQQPTAKEMEQMAAALDVTTASEFMRLFFPQMSTKWTA